MPQVIYEYDGEVVEHSYAMPESSDRPVATNITQTTPQHNTSLKHSQHATTLTTPTAFTPSQCTTTLTPSQLTEACTPQDHAAAARVSYSNPTQPTGTSSQRKRRRVQKFSQEATYEASLDMQRREHELHMKSLQMSIELNREAMNALKNLSQEATNTLQKFSQVADLILEKFK